MPMIDQVLFLEQSKTWSFYHVLLYVFKFFTLTCATIDLCFVIQGEKDDKIIAVCADDPAYNHYSDIRELPPHRLTEIRRFFEDCILYYTTLKLNYSLHLCCWTLYGNYLQYEEQCIVLLNIFRRQEEWAQRGCSGWIFALLNCRGSYSVLDASLSYSTTSSWLISNLTGC